MSMQPVPWPEPDAQVAAVVRAIYRRRELPLPVTIRDMLGEVFPDAGFASAYGRGAVRASRRGCLALVSVLQTAREADRSAGRRAARRRICRGSTALGLAAGGSGVRLLGALGVPGPGARGRVWSSGCSMMLLAALVERGLVKGGGRQRTDSTHVVSAVRDLNRLELAGESVRAAVEAVIAAAPGWFADGVRRAGLVGALRAADRLLASAGRADQARPARRTTTAPTDTPWSKRCTRQRAPFWLRELPAVQVLRTVLVQNYYAHRRRHREAGDQTAGCGQGRHPAGPIADRLPL